MKQAMLFHVIYMIVIIVLFALHWASEIQHQNTLALKKELIVKQEELISEYTKAVERLR